MTCPECDTDNWIGADNQICANCLRGLSRDDREKMAAIPNDELRELVEKWREHGSGCRCCISRAGELEELLND